MLVKCAFTYINYSKFDLPNVEPSHKPLSCVRWYRREIPTIDQQKKALSCLYKASQLAHNRCLLYYHSLSLDTPIDKQYCWAVALALYPLSFYIFGSFR
jgi:hypothetical protein